MWTKARCCLNKLEQVSLIEVEICKCEVWCFVELPAIESLRTRLLALRLLETVLPSPTNVDVGRQRHVDVSEQHQIVDTLLSNMSAAVWSSPVPEAVETVARQKREMEASIAELSASDCQPVSGSVSAASSSTDIADVSFDVDKILNCTVENGQTLIHGAGGRGYGLAGIPVSSGCYQWKVVEWIHWVNPAEKTYAAFIKDTVLKLFIFSQMSLISK